MRLILTRIPRGPRKVHASPGAAKSARIPRGPSRIPTSTSTFQVIMMWRKEAPNLMDLMGGCVVVVTTAAKGEIHGGCTLAEDAVMLLGQSVQGVYVFRGLRAVAWITMVKALQASPNKVRQAVDRAERVAARLTRMGMAAPSPSHRAAGGRRARSAGGAVQGVRVPDRRWRVAASRVPGAGGGRGRS